ncbi:hypothetical protein [Planococcus sp. MB-3u-03]|nr:hypothetical protein [Planococcus sp. MB-3u-03]
MEEIQSLDKQIQETTSKVAVVEGEIEQTTAEIKDLKIQSLS